jgi:CBS domain-containing protein
VRLSDFLAPSRVVIPLPGDTLLAAARVLIDRLDAAGEVIDADKLRRRVAEERAEDLVAMTDRAFVLHFRTDAVREIVVALGVAAAPVARELGGHETQRARIVLMVVAPPRFAARHLQLVGGFVRTLSRPSVVEAILGLRDPAAISALPAFADYALREQLAVRDIMTEQPRTVNMETALRDAARDMVLSGVSGLPVVDDDGRVVGMLSERELLRHLLNSHLVDADSRPTPPGGMTRRHVRDAMTRQVLCVSPDQPLAEVAALMSNKDVERVPVVREGRLVGFLTRGDIVRKLIGSY